MRAGPHAWACGLLVVGSLVYAAGSGVRAQGDDLRLIEAVKRQNTQAVRELLVQRVDVQATQADGATALHWAAYRDDLDTAMRLLGAGANAGAENDYGITPLSLVCTNANASMVQALLAAGADASAAVSTGETVLMTCARTGSVDAVDALVDHGADVNAPGGVAEPDGVDVAGGAGAHRGGPRATRAGRGCRGAVARLASRHQPAPAVGPEYGERGRSIGSDAEETDVAGLRPCCSRARHGEIESARLLLDAGASLNDAAPDGARRAWDRRTQPAHGVRPISLGRGRQPRMPPRSAMRRCTPQC